MDSEASAVAAHDSRAGRPVNLISKTRQIVLKPARPMTLERVAVLRPLLDESVWRLNNNELRGELLTALEELQPRSLRQVFYDVYGRHEVEWSHRATPIEESFGGDISY